VHIALRYTAPGPQKTLLAGTDWQHNNHSLGITSLAKTEHHAYGASAYRAASNNGRNSVFTRGTEARMPAWH